jgi:hypothetical protein
MVSDPGVMDNFLLWLDAQMARRWDDKECRYSGMIALDAREPGAYRWETLLGRIEASFVDELPPTTTVTMKGRAFEVVGLSHLAASDSYAERVLERVRMRLASSS